MPLEMKYFVLNPRSKKKHDHFAFASRKAMITYASYINSEDQELGKELFEWAERERIRQKDMPEDESQ